jgi:hypothetical protein
MENKKVKSLNTKILKKITNKVKFTKIEENGVTTYELYQKNFTGNWILLLRTDKINKLLQRKHNAWRLSIYSMGFRGFFRERAKKRDRQRKKRNNN